MLLKKERDMPLEIDEPHVPGPGEPGGAEKERDIPLEIDEHFKLFGKEPWEVDYGEKCPVCNVRIDEYGFCSCGSSGE